jgi:hypothetical protein
MHEKKLLSTVERVLVVAVCLSCLLFSGIVFGFANLRLVLERDGQFHELCDTPEEGARNISLLHNHSGIGEVCKSQDDQFNLMYTIATCAVAAAGLPCGMFLDNFGPALAALASMLR